MTMSSAEREKRALDIKDCFEHSIISGDYDRARSSAVAALDEIFEVMNEHGLKPDMYPISSIISLIASLNAGASHPLSARYKKQKKGARPKQPSGVLVARAMTSALIRWLEGRMSKKTAVLIVQAALTRSGYLGRKNKPISESTLNNWYTETADACYEPNLRAAAADQLSKLQSLAPAAKLSDKKLAELIQLQTDAIARTMALETPPPEKLTNPPL